MVMKLSARPLPKKTQNGSAIFIILIGIALFAALSFMVAQMLRQGNPDMISEQKAQLMADEIIQYGHSVRSGIQDMKISNGCADSAISFENVKQAGYEHTPVTTETCKIFSSLGGGVNYLNPSDDWLDEDFFGHTTFERWYATGASCVEDVPNEDSTCSTDGEDNEDLVMLLHFVKKQLCVEINEKAGIDNPGGDPPAADSCHATATLFTGAFAEGTDIADTELNGHAFGCFAQNNMCGGIQNYYAYYHVVNPR